MSMQEVMDPQTHSGDDWTWDGHAWIMRPIHFPQRPRPPFPPPFPPCPPFPTRPINGPIAGVTTGAAARPGEVGEFLMGSSNIGVAINPAAQNLLAQPLVLPPGDWDVEASLYVPGLVCEAMWLVLTPVPPGVTPNLVANSSVITANAEFAGIITTNRGQALVNVPTLLPFLVQITNATSTSSALLTATARRMR